MPTICVCFHVREFTIDFDDISSGVSNKSAIIDLTVVLDKQKGRFVNENMIHVE